MATLYKKRGKYYIEFTLEGKRCFKSTFLDATKANEKKAINMKKDIEAILRKSKTPIFEFNLESEKSNEVSLVGAVNIYFRDHLSSKSKSHQDTFVNAISHLYKIVGRDTNIKKISTEHFSEFVKYLSPKVRNATIRTYITYLKGFFNYLVEEDLIIKSPIKSKFIPKPVGKNIITFEEDMLNEILKAAKTIDPMFHNILKMLLLTGIRPCDLLNLKAGDIDLKNLVIHLDISKTQRQIKYPLYNELLNFVKSNLPYINTLDRDDFIFPGYNVNMLGKKFRRLKKSLGIEEKLAYTLKTFRKTFATNLADKGLDRADVADLLGHSIIETTRKYYVNTKAKTLRDKLNKLSKKDKNI